MVEISLSSRAVFMGAGGGNPRVDIFDPDTGEVRPYMKLPQGHSAYAMGIGPSGIFAVGTRGGLLRLQENGHHTHPETSHLFIDLFQGAAILSTCFCNDALVAVSDSIGRCLLWHNKAPHQPVPLETKDGLICSLASLPNRELVGCSTEGKLLFWQIPEGRLVRVMDISKPPSMSALVRMVYWGSEEVLVCPGSGGQLNVCYLEKDQVRQLDVHQGDVYAFSLSGTDLLTIGLTDGRLRLWKLGQEKPVKDMAAPENIILLTMCGFLPPRMIMINTDGKASLYTVEKEGLQLIAPIQGTDYRAMETQDHQNIIKFEMDKREEAVKEIIGNIRANMNRGSLICTEEDHAELTTLGYQHVSLAIRAEQAVQEQDITEAIRLYASLIDYLPATNPNSVPSLEKYAEMLKLAWRVTEATSIYESILKAEPEHPARFELNRLAPIERIMREEPCAIESDISVDTLINSANVLEKKFAGTYVLSQLNARTCRQVTLTPKTIASKYNIVTQEDGNGKTPPAEAVRLWWISRNKMEEIEIVVIQEEATNAFHRLKYVLRVICDELNTLIIPVVLFDWPYDQRKISVKQGNQEALETLRQMRANDLCNNYLTAIHKNVDHALRRLITESRSGK